MTQIYFLLSQSITDNQFDHPDYHDIRFYQNVRIGPYRIIIFVSEATSGDGSGDSTESFSR